MKKYSSYCEYVKTLENENPHKIYHDTQYGYTISNDDELFGQLILEINQAGLSWTTVLKKKENIKKAFSNFNIEKIANYSNKDILRLLNDKGIIRNNLKINAIIHNAKRIVAIQKEYGSFLKWTSNFSAYELSEWTILFKTNFKFTGGEITKEFLLSSGIIKGAHIPSCTLYNKLKNLNKKTL
jgi:DNA-3-methyladenine glycosylase I